MFILLLSHGCSSKKIEDEKAQRGIDTSSAKQKSAKQEVTLQKKSKFHFKEIAVDAGIIFHYRNGQEAKAFAILESLGGGVGIFDYDRDGQMDLFFTGGGSLENQASSGAQNGLFRNLANWKFDAVAPQVFLEESEFYSHGVAAGDVDNDGFQDLLITGYGGLQFFQNQGDGTFLRRDIPGMDDGSWSTSAGWADLNGDQLLDLYVCHYVNWSWENHPHCGPKQAQDVCSPRKFEGLPDSIFINNGDGSFSDVSAECGLTKSGKGLGVLLCDLEPDGDVDIYVANDTTDNFLYINDGKGKFTESGRSSGTSLGEAGVADGSMGVDVCDYNGDLQSDIWVANFEAESFGLYRAEGNDFFLHVSMITGVTRLGSSFVGFGTAWSDFDFDGDEDAVVSNGHVIYLPLSAPIRQKPLLLQNDKGRINRIKFSEEDYFGRDYIGRGLALGDLDNDGDLDISVSHVNEQVAVLKNNVQKKGNWVSVELIGTNSNRFSIGATLVLETEKRKMIRHVKGCTSYLSTFDNRVFWGIPKGESVRKLTINWPSGLKQELDSIELNHQATILEPF